MYSSGYSQVSKRSPGAQKRMQYRSKGKSCGYYMRIVFFFSSLIQSLIIVSLVLFLVYGKTQDSASTERIHDLEESFSRLSIENVALRQQRKNLTNLLNTTLTLKARNDWDLEKFRHYTNISSFMIVDFDRKLQQCKHELFMCSASPRFPCDCSARTSDNCNCGLLAERLKARLELVESNFTQATKRMRIEMDQTAKERDYINLEAIRLRREKSIQEKELLFNKERCKDDFFQSLSGVSNVSKAFLMKIESLFPTHLAFQLTCSKQREYLEQIHTNCSSLSREVEDKFQHYLNSVGDQVSDIHAENSRLKAENWRLSSDYRSCTQNRTGLIKEHREKLDRLQQKHDQDKERLLMDKMRLNGDIEVLVNNVKFKIKEVDHLTQQIRHLNMSCMSKPGFAAGSNSRPSTSSQSVWSTLGGGGSSSASGAQLSRTGSGGLGSSLGSSGSLLNKPVSTGTGSSSSSHSLFGSSSSLGSSGSLLNKPVSTGTGSSSSSHSLFGSSSSLGSSGSLLNKLGSTGTGSSSSSHSSSGSSSSLGSTGLNKPGSTGGASSTLGSSGSSSSLSLSGIGSNKQTSSVRSSSGIGSSSGSTGSSSSLSSSGIGSNKPTSSVKSPSGVGSSSGSTGSTSKTAPNSFSWFGFGNNNGGQSKTGSATGKGTTSGNSNGGTGSALGAGRSSGLGGGSVNVAQHLQDLQRLINPSGQEEKQDLSRMLG
ncbi:plasmalemma vesicle associated protein a isoform X4 [Hippoglossus hippoglossus]|uniref:plasmalemma vesicle associated protein a isoform X4 n=1 Tax=Hippoglossus hippoglossus TaxID=8267 RepID=UPI00148E6429|nr:plasmalemma vesicle associated protein a isoform X4 [Hippoglossus hippoglossus]